MALSCPRFWRLIFIDILLRVGCESHTVIVLTLFYCLMPYSLSQVV